MGASASVASSFSPSFPSSSPSSSSVLPSFVADVKSKSERAYLLAQHICAGEHDNHSALTFKLARLLDRGKFSREQLEALCIGAAARDRVHCLGAIVRWADKHFPEGLQLRAAYTVATFNGSILCREYFDEYYFLVSSGSV